MALPSLPAQGSTSWYPHYSKMHDSLDRVSQVGGVLLDDFDGGTDDIKLTAALAYAAAQTYKPAILLGNRRYDFNTQRTMFPGMRIYGASPGSYDQVRSGNPFPTAVYLNIGGNNGWLVAPDGLTPGVNIGRLSFNGNASTRWMHPNAAANIQTGLFEDLSFNGFRSVIGSQGVNMPFTITTFRGFWNINNGAEVQIAIGGSDCSMWETGSINLDSPPALRADSSDLIRFGALSKSTVGPIYLTADRSSGAVINSTNVGQLVIRGMRYEGRNANTPCHGAVLRVSGNSGYVLRDSWFGYAMSNPATNGRNDKGVIHISDGEGLIDTAWYGRATGVSEDVPFIYCEGGTVYVRNIFWQRNQAQGAGKKPVVVKTGTGKVYADNSVTVTDAAGTVIAPDGVL